MEKPSDIAKGFSFAQKWGIVKITIGIVKITIGSVKNTIAENKKTSLDCMTLEEKVKYFQGLRDRENFEVNKDEEFY